MPAAANNELYTLSPATMPRKTNSAWRKASGFSAATKPMPERPLENRLCPSRPCRSVHPMPTRPYALCLGCPHAMSIVYHWMPGHCDAPGRHKAFPFVVPGDGADLPAAIHAHQQELVHASGGKAVAQQNAGFAIEA
jgi:hypothetical protein